MSLSITTGSFSGDTNEINKKKQNIENIFEIFSRAKIYELMKFTFIRQWSILDLTVQKKT